MIALDLPHRRANPDDDVALTELVNMAGEGLPLYLWRKLAEPGQDPWEVGRQRVRRETGSFTYRNAVVREEEGRVVAALIGYGLPEQVEVADYRSMPAMFVPMQELEDEAHGSWYINVLATFPDHRGKGYGRELLAIAEQMARDARRRRLCVTVSDANVGARRLYERLGFREMARRPMVKEQWQNPGSEWVLLTRPVRGYVF